MEEENLKFNFELVTRKNNAYQLYGKNNCSITLEHHSEKNYFKIDFVLKSKNLIYKDSMVFYLNEDVFDPAETLKNFDNIMGKAKHYFNNN